MNCWKCFKSISDGVEKIGFRAACPHCSSDLHVCVNCMYYTIGKPNDCLIPGTEPVRDREKANFCEDFKPLSCRKDLPQKDKSQKNFNSLFKDTDS